MAIMPPPRGPSDLVICPGQNTAGGGIVMSQSASKQKTLIFICTVLFLDAAGFSLIMPIMPDLISGMATLTNAQAARIAGYLLFAFAIMQFVFAPILGSLSDRYGRRPVLLLALVGFTLDYFLMAWAPTLFWLFAARIISGICGATFAAANASIVDISCPEDRARLFGLSSAAIGLGFVFGPAIGGILGEYHVRLPFIAAGGLTAIALLYGIFTFPETLQDEHRRPFSLKRANPVGSLLAIARYRVVLILLAALFFIQLANHSYSSIWAFYVKEITGWTPFLIGLSVSFYGILMAGVQGGLTGPAVKAMGEIRLVYLCVCAGLLSFGILAFAQNGGMIYLGILTGALSGFIGPSMQSLMTCRTPADAQGELQGAITSLYSIASVLSPPVMALIFAAHSDDKGYYLPGAPFLLAAGLILISMCIATLAFSQMRWTNREAIDLSVSPER